MALASTSWLLAGKTTVITGTVERLLNRPKIGYADGDIATSIDAERIVADAGRPDQHRRQMPPDANMLAPAVDKLPLDDINLMI